MTNRIALALFVLLPALGRAGEVRVGIDDAVRFALERNTELRAAAADVVAARSRLDASRILVPSNPSLDVAAGPRMRDGDRSLDLGVALSQPVELAGQRGARVELADAGVALSRARLATRRAEIAATVREAFGRALASADRAMLASEAVALSEQAHGAVAERVRVGKAARLELNAATVDLARSRREEARSRQEQRAALSAFRLVLGDTSVVPEGALDGLAAREPRAGSGAPGRHPEVVAAREALREARAERDLAARWAIPAVRVGAAYAREEGADIVQATLGLDLPLFRRNQAERGTAAARIGRAEAELAAAERRVGETLQLAGARVDSARGALAAFTGGALAAAEENVALAAEGYDAGKIGFLELLLVRRDAVETRRAHIDALEELNAAEAERDRATASP